ncbi:MAG TPA: Crp/Fnr family transcriptional regulator [Firmicutes bacterium]|nr:Crp/Fnr family transcriptional regulator [Bacillota bacterium]
MSCTRCQDKFCTYKVPIFKNFNCSEVDELLKVIEHKQYKKGEILFNEGDLANTLYIINEGSLKLFRYTKDGKEQILHILKAGDFFGELQLLKETNFECYAKALEDCNVCTLTKEHFHQLMLQKSEMSFKVLEVVSDRLVHLEKLAILLSDNDTEAKLAYLLLELAEQYGNKTGSTIQINLPFSREEMANYTGLTRETISRKLKIFSDQGIINIIGHKKIEILDVDYFKQLI